MIVTDRLSRAATRRFLGGTLSWGVVLVAAALLFSLLLTCTVAVVAGPIRVSGWHTFVPVVKAFAAVLGVISVAAALPRAVAHGRTRREFAAQLVLAALVSGVAMAALIGAGYGVEWLLYQAMDWPQRMGEDGPRLSTARVTDVMTQLVLVLPSWVMAGALFVAGYARRGSLGIAMVVVAAILVGLADTTVGGDGLTVPLLSFGSLGDGAPPWMTAATCVAVYAALSLLTWAVLRGYPMRSRP